MKAAQLNKYLEAEERAMLGKAETQFEKDCTTVFEVIPLSQSYADYKDSEPDKEWLGLIDGIVNGWSVEYRNKDGRYEYGSVHYLYGTIEEEIARFEAPSGSWYFDTPRAKGYEPTGRVVFRGYGILMWDSWERDYYVEAYEPELEAVYIK